MVVSNAAGAAPAAATGRTGRPTCLTRKFGGGATGRQQDFSGTMSGHCRCHTTPHPCLHPRHPTPELRPTPAGRSMPAHTLAGPISLSRYGLVGGDSSRRFMAIFSFRLQNRRLETPPTTKTDRPWIRLADCYPELEGVNYGQRWHMEIADGATDLSASIRSWRAWVWRRNGSIR